MGLGNKATRKTAIPFRANTMGLDVYNAIGTGNALGGLIRFCRPKQGDIIEAKMLLQATTSVQAPTSVYFYKGELAADGVTAQEPSERQYLPQGADFGSQANVFFDDVDLTGIIPKRGDADYNEDFFVVGVEIGAKDPLGWILYQFKVEASAQMGVL